MTVFPIIQRGVTTDVVVTLSHYPNYKNRLQLYDSEDGCPYAVCSMNSDVLIEEDEIIIKTYSENEGILEFLIKNNIVSNTGKTIKIGRINSPICIIHPQHYWGTDRIFNHSFEFSDLKL